MNALAMQAAVKQYRGT
uniref:Uncharacterized protein n=1 Tax=Moniliophthora roreri TaxID=221103 RepID=A0A0W0FQT8_MONRR